VKYFLYFLFWENSVLSTNSAVFKFDIKGILDQQPNSTTY